MIAQRPSELTGARDKQLTKEDLLKIFTEEQINDSTYSNRYGEAIRLFNRYEEEAQVPALYKYEKGYIEAFQRTYSNVTTYKIEKQQSRNRVIDVVLYTTCYAKYSFQTPQAQPPLPEDVTNESN
jgi:hypothetical protein